MFEGRQLWEVLFERIDILFHQKSARLLNKKTCILVQEQVHIRAQQRCLAFFVTRRYAYRSKDFASLYKKETLTFAQQEDMYCCLTRRRSSFMTRGLHPCSTRRIISHYLFLFVYVYTFIYTCMCIEVCRLT